MTPAQIYKSPRTISLIGCCCAFLALTIAPLRGQTFSLHPSAAFGAGGVASNGIFSVRGSMGQPSSAAQPMSGGDFSSVSGYWTVPEVSTPAPPDFLQLVMSSTNLQSGQIAAMPISLGTSAGITSLAFNLPWPSAYFDAPQLIAVDPAVGSGYVQITGANLSVVIQAAPGQVFQNTQPIALLSFSESANQPQSGFVSLPITGLTAAKPNGSTYTNVAVQSATVAVINDVPLLVATVSTNLGRSLNLYGWAGTNYQLQYSTDLISWQPVSNYVQNNGVFSVSVNSTNAGIFYRVKQP